MADETGSSSGGRDWFLSAMAGLYVILAFSDFTKAFQFAKQPSRGGLVIFGTRIESFAGNLIAGPIFGIFLLTIAYGLWSRRRWVLTILMFYAFYVPTNMVMFWSLRNHEPPTVRFIVIYLILALGGSVGTALYLAYNRDKLA